MGRSSIVRSGVIVPGFIAWPLVVAGLGAAIWGANHIGRQWTTTRVQSAGLRIEDIRKIARLAVLRVQVADVIEGRTRGARAVVLVQGDADIAIDLDQIELARQDPAARTVTLLLPAPRPDRPRVDHQRTRVYEIEKTGLAAINPFAEPRRALLEDCMRAAQDDVARAVDTPELVSRAKDQAELLLREFYRELGWTVAVVWK